MHVVSHGANSTCASHYPLGRAPDSETTALGIVEAAAKEIAELKIPEKIVGTPSLADASMADRIIFTPLRIIGQHCIGFGDLAKLGRGIGVFVPIGMILKRQLPVSMFDLIARGRAVDAPKSS